MRVPARGLRILERGALLSGALLLGWVGWQLAAAQWYQRVEGWRLDHRLQAQPASTAPLPGTEFRAVRARAAGGRGEPLGRLVIARLGVSAVVAEGDDDDTLARAVGHLPSTAFPGERGNTVLAAHRDSFFHSLGHLRPGDVIELRTPDGRFRYRVERLAVVGPEHTEVSAATSEPALTLITCYPFNYIGPAPLRYVVRASLLPHPTAVSTG